MEAVVATIGVGGIGGYGWEGEAACGLEVVIWMLLMFFPWCRASGPTAANEDAGPYLPS